MDTSLDHFDEDDLAIIKALEDDDAGNAAASNATNQQAATQQGEQGEQGGQGASANTSETSDSTSADKTDTNAADQVAGAAAAEGHESGNVKAALRAARRAERRAREALERTQRELDELKQRHPAATNQDGELDEAIAEDFPQIAAALKKRDEQITRLNEQLNQRARETTTEQDQEFTPPVLPIEVQEVVDEIPELLDLQHNPDQTGWKLAVGFDATLRAHPVWGEKSAQERFAEAARRARMELAGDQPVKQQSTQAPSDTEAARAKAAKAVAAATRREPETLSDFGGAAAEPEGSNLARFSRMSEDDITNELLRGG